MNANSKEMPVASNPKWQILDATTLKFLAVLLMVLDHIHEMFVSMGAPMWLTMAGRLVFSDVSLCGIGKFLLYAQQEKVPAEAFICQLGYDHFYIYITGRSAKPRRGFDEQCLQHFLCDGPVYAVLGYVEGGYTAEVTKENR